MHWFQVSEHILEGLISLVALVNVLILLVIRACDEIWDENNKRERKRSDKPKNHKRRGLVRNEAPKEMNERQLGSHRLQISGCYSYTWMIVPWLSKENTCNHFWISASTNRASETES